jgi:hypothetical protein
LVYTETARLIFPLPDSCSNAPCHAVVKFFAFGAGITRLVAIQFEGKDWQWKESLVSTSGDFMDVKIPLPPGAESRSVDIAIPSATSPKALTGSPDARVLGIALQRIELVKP